MALTPEDVVNKRFQPTKFREGYDQDEVDDFLDEVVVELRRLNQENDELKQRLTASDSRVSELQRSSGQAAPAAAEQPAPVAAVVPPVVAAPAAAPAAATVAEDETASTNNLLQLARRLHEEHVREGAQKRDALIAEGHATAARIVAEAESKQRAQISALDQERTGLEHRIDELRSFERDYRAKLKSYIEGQLKDLDASAVSANPAPVSAASGQFSSTSQPPVNESAGVTQPPTLQSFGG
jgi:DivIVA domain-containing protein